jgi:hypothetical protein
MKYIVKSIDSSVTYEWLLKKHYAKSIPNIIYAFGLFDENLIIQGVCCYGTPANNHNNNVEQFKQIELVRLVINDDMPKNTLSFFLAKTLKFLPSPLSIISYADAGKNHHGYIYQATNWIYTGLGGGVDFYINEEKKEIHSRIMSDYRLKYPDKSRSEIAEMLKWKKIKGTFKHRYYYFIGNKRDKKLWTSIIKEKFGIKCYPKGDNVRYDASYKPLIQTELF